MLAGLVTHLPSLTNPFVFDDMDSIVGNPDVRTIWPPTWLMAKNNVSDVTSPLSHLTLAVNYSLSGTDPTGFRVFNIALHLLNGALLLVVLRRAFSGERLAPLFGPRAGQLALLTALLFVVHPLQTQVLNYIVQRSGMLMTAALLGSLVCVQQRGRGWTASAIVLCAAGMLSKESMAAAPVVLVLYDLLFGKERRPILWAGLALTWLPLAGLLLTRPHGPTIGFDHGVTTWAYLLNQSEAIVGYLWLMVWPHPLILDYGPPDPSLRLVQVWPEAVVVLAAIGLTVWLLLRCPAAGFCLAWFFLLIAPTSSLIPFVNEGAAERRIYLAIAGPVVLLICLGYRGVVLWSPSPRALRTAGVAGLLVVAMMIAASHSRHRDFRSSRSIWQATVEDRPNNPRAHSALAMELRSEGFMAEALAEYQQAIALRPGYADAYNNMAMILADLGRHNEAIAPYREAIRYKPGFFQAHNNLAAAYSALGRWEEAIVEYRRAIELSPAYARAHTNLGMALAETGHTEEALDHYREALHQDPEYARARDNLVDGLNSLGIKLEEAGDVSAALGKYQEAIEVDSTAYFVHYNLGLAYQSAGAWVQAAVSYRRTLRFKPDYLDAQERLQVVQAKVAE